MQVLAIMLWCIASIKMLAFMLALLSHCWCAWVRRALLLAHDCKCICLFVETEINCTSVDRFDTSGLIQVKWTNLFAGLFHEYTNTRTSIGKIQLRTVSTVTLQDTAEHASWCLIALFRQLTHKCQNLVQVLVLRMQTKGSVEERILEASSQKRSLADRSITGKKMLAFCSLDSCHFTAAGHCYQKHQSTPCIEANHRQRKH